MAPSGILYQNDAKDVALIDIPTSITAAQGFSEPQPSLVSCKPRHETYTIGMEPQTAKARAEFAKRGVSAELQNIYLPLIQNGLEEIHSKQSSGWHLTRKYTRPREQEDPEKKKKRRLRRRNHKGRAIMPQKQESRPDHLPEEELTEEELPRKKPGPSIAPKHPDEDSLGEWLEYLAGSTGPANPFGLKLVDPKHEDAPDTVSTAESGPNNHNAILHNPKDHLMSLEISRKSTHANPVMPQIRFHIPPKSTFILGDCSNAQIFNNGARRLSEQQGLPREFDLIIMDPPWPNASSRQYQPYGQVKLSDMRDMLVEQLDLSRYLSRKSLVGVWITNSRAVRGFVLDKGGLFDTLNVDLIEEWIWIKTTKAGEPECDIHSLFRKPYEVFLLGRVPEDFSAPPPTDIKRRVIAGVPDIHSRKPCLKELLEDFMPDRNNYAALEVFARYLVKGWTSWGNEALKFNWDGYWVKEESDFVA